MKTKATLPQALAFPDELIEEILLRLLVKSLLRFKCVCKSWFSFISNPQFAKSHFDLAVAPTHRLLLKFPKDSVAKSVDKEAPLHNDSTEVVFNIPDPSPVPKRRCWVDVVGSCRGCLLLTTVSYGISVDVIYFLIWNPSTGLQKRFNKECHWYEPYVCGIGYDSSTNDYVVVIITFPPQRNGLLGTEVHCFSSRTDSWSCTKGTVRYITTGKKQYEPHLNGALHWLVKSYDDLLVIIAFDVMERRLSEIPLPHDLALRLQTKIYHLRVMGGCLCLCHPGSRIAPAEVWTMTEYKLQSSWTKSLVVSTNCSLPLYRFFPICSTKNGEVLGYNGSKTLVRLNNKGELLKRRAYGQYNGRYDLLHGGMYRESLLSLPGNFEKFTKRI
ncbi:F-box/kelch-repeat protein [Spatholobus suberectus]|nr:F-box/kelch-repeat protein [Spatholobus suberectus]